MQAYVSSSLKLSAAILMASTLLLPFSAALRVGLSPPELWFNESPDGKCSEIQAFSDKGISLSISSRVSNSASKRVNDCIYPESFLLYPHKIDLLGKAAIEICVEEMPPHDVHGLLIFEIENTSFAEGAWFHIIVDQAHKTAGRQQDGSAALQLLLLGQSIALILCFFCVMSARKRRAKTSQLTSASP